MTSLQPHIIFLDEVGQNTERGSMYVLSKADQSTITKARPFCPLVWNAQMGQYN